MIQANKEKKGKNKKKKCIVASNVESIRRSGQ